MSLLAMVGHQQLQLLLAEGLSMLAGDQKGHKTVDKRVLVVVNPLSEDSIKKAVVVVNELIIAGYRITIVASSADGKVQITPDPLVFGMVIIAGGDGTISKFLSAYNDHKQLPVVGIIPGGTTNEFAAQYGITKSNYVSVILNGIVKKIDTTIINGRTAIYSITCGLYTEATYTTPQNLKNAFGELAYIVYGLTHRSKTQLPMRIFGEALCRFDGKKSYQECIFFGVTNTHSIGGGIIKIPIDNLNLFDGRNEFFYVLKPQSRKDYLKFFYDVIARKPFSNPNVRFNTVDSLSLSTMQPLVINVDGESLKVEQNIEIAVQPGKLRILCPQVINTTLIKRPNNKLWKKKIHKYSLGGDNMCSSDEVGDYLEEEEIDENECIHQKISIIDSLLYDLHKIRIFKAMSDKKKELLIALLSELATQIREAIGDSIDEFIESECVECGKYDGCTLMPSMIDAVNQYNTINERVIKVLGS